MGCWLAVGALMRQACRVGRGERAAVERAAWRGEERVESRCHLHHHLALDNRRESAMPWRPCSALVSPRGRLVAELLSFMSLQGRGRRGEAR